MCITEGCAATALALTFRGVPVAAPSPSAPSPVQGGPCRDLTPPPGLAKATLAVPRGHADTSHQGCVLGSIRQEGWAVGAETCLQGRKSYEITKQMASPTLPHFPPFLSPCNGTEFIDIFRPCKGKSSLNTDWVRKMTFFSPTGPLGVPESSQSTSVSGARQGSTRDVKNLWAPLPPKATAGL